METIPNTRSQTRSFTTIFLIEMWERFGFYGMQALIVYYMVQRLGFPDERATLVWGAAAALIYVAPAIGGWIGDKILGTRRTMLLGAVVLSLGYTLMVVPGQSVWFLFFALGVIVVGNGLFKANAGNLVRKIYEGDDSRIDSAFTIYYMAVNLGAMISQLLTPWLKDYVNETYGNELGWHVAFAVCAIGLLLGLINYWLMRRTMDHIGSEPDELPLHWGKLGAVIAGSIVAVFASAYILEHQGVARAFVYLAGVVVIGIFAYLISTGQRSERAGLIAALVLTVQTVFYFIFYQQMSTSLALFALRNVDPSFVVLVCICGIGHRHSSRPSTRSGSFFSARSWPGFMSVQVMPARIFPLPPSLFSASCWWLVAFLSTVLQSTLQTRRQGVLVVDGMGLWRHFAG